MIFSIRYASVRPDVTEIHNIKSRFETFTGLSDLRTYAMSLSSEQHVLFMHMVSTAEYLPVLYDIDTWLISYADSIKTESLSFSEMIGKVQKEIQTEFRLKSSDFAHYIYQSAPADIHGSIKRRILALELQK